MAQASRTLPPETSLNAAVAERLRELARLLLEQESDGFRIAAYRHAAETLEMLPEGIDEIYARKGLAGLQGLPSIGRGIAAAIEEMLLTGRWGKLERLRGASDPLRLFQAVPGIGPALAERIHEHLHIDTLEALELAAHDGHLASVPGIGPRRAAAIRASLTSILGRVRPTRHETAGERPPVRLLLTLDAEYREAAQSGKLLTIAPKRFNPAHEAWLPIMHARREGWEFTLMFSNTARAHELGRTRDWVVIYHYDDHHQEGQHTVVTETHGPLEGERVVRGREAECREHYRT